MGNKMWKVFLVILLILLIALAGFYYLDITKDKEIQNQIIANQILENTLSNVEVNEPSSENPNFQGFNLSIEEYPKVDGSTATKPMSVEIASEVLGISKMEAEGNITHNTTKQAYENLIGKKTDLIFVEGEPDENILNVARENNVEFTTVPLANDSLVFYVSKENKVDNLSVGQIQDIYRGAIGNWKDLGGEDSSIIPYQKEANSGSQRLMRTMVMGDIQMLGVPTKMVESMGKLTQQMQTYQNSRQSIGYSIYSYAKELYVQENMKFLKINDIYPSEGNIKNGTYPLSKKIYAIYRKDENKDSNVVKLIDWLKTTSGQEVIQRSDYLGADNR